ncbi:MAG: PilZ domain-containing protein [Methylococcaceae bacterium]|nr:PilZ domain-containing protein [Methylococcaceae bacterium]
MLEYDEKRNYDRMDVDCELTYRLADSDVVQQGCCTSISGAGMSFIAAHSIELGKALEIRILPGKSISPPLVAFIETVRCIRQADGHFEIAAAIKGIKAD